jgi:hypothetical protein
MADRIEWFAVTIPANTPVATPVTLPLVFQQGSVTEIDVKVPPGPSGNVGFFIGAGGSQYVPRTAGSYIMPNDDFFTWPMENAINSGSWSLTGYNTDIYPHTIQVGFQVNELNYAQAAQVASLGTSSASLPADITSNVTPAVVTVDPLSVDALLASVPDLTTAVS